ncbi:MAG: SAM-dependent methyltransferase [Chloroflexi bacterium]|nr:SAM-dependent methyltransferase [Chloroflexota bacterium]
MAQNINFDRFKNLTYESFREMAKDPNLTEFEKVGFPDSYREGRGEAIFADILAKLPRLNEQGLTVVDIGPGCSDPAKLMIAHCGEHNHKLIMIDAPEMLDLLPDAPHLIKMPGYYPKATPQLFTDYAGKVDVLLAYGVVSIIFAEGLLYPFIDQTLGLMASGAQWLIGDFPNISKRKRFFGSETGIAFHKAFMNTDEAPEVDFNTPEPGQIDDGVMLGILARVRGFGFDSFLLPQRADLPMANRREDILILKP